MPTKKTTKSKDLEADEVKKQPEVKEEVVVAKPVVQPSGEVLDSDNDLVQDLEHGQGDDTIDPSADSKIEKYYLAIGRRKEATAQVRLYTKKSSDAQTDENKAIVVVNGKSYDEYFQLVRLQNVVESPLKKIKSLNRFKATVVVSGGGIAGQADAVKLGLSRSLVLFDPNFAKKLRRAGFLSRDARVKERRKYGLKKARKRGQWSKR